MTAGPHPFWSYAFRPFFAAAGGFAVLAMGQWLLVLRGQPWPADGNFSTVWHAHEMTVGFAGAVVAGFLLTAVATWTGRPPVRGARLVLLVGAWLLGRLALWLGSGLPPLVVAAADLLFPAALAMLVTREVVAAGNRRNYVIALLAWILALLTFAWHGGAAASQLGLLAPDTGAAVAGLAAQLLLQLLVLLITVIGGRVVPAFTTNWLRMQGATRLPVTRAWLEPLVIGATALAGISWSVAPASAVASVFCLLAGAGHALRLAGWRGLATVREPLLFVLHLAYGALAVGFGLLGAIGLGLPLAPTAGLHALAIGAVAGMILAMMTRVALGHTGRPLKAAPVTVAAYVLLALAALLRVLGPGWSPGALADYALGSYDLSGLCWMMSFALFLWHYLPILVAPRTGP